MNYEIRNCKYGIFAALLSACILAAASLLFQKKTARPTTWSGGADVMSYWNDLTNRKNQTYGLATAEAAENSRYMVHIGGDVNKEKDSVNGKKQVCINVTAHGMSFL